ncbi:hypothetical protein IWW36_003597 [Coemansia brasiliensis]|uniref:Phosphatidic acid phosphatase type 2/haloperoxidase domain-containing protein n=1 Tax=Coemansia brasiliensis TaxID=2650707 RepID=A0A9W8LX23_9FUNG|nr:hypothetical protein IWW36_003597 [Coemansia brasiliensis]
MPLPNTTQSPPQTPIQATLHPQKRESKPGILPRQSQTPNVVQSPAVSRPVQSSSSQAPQVPSKPVTKPLLQPSQPAKNARPAQTIQVQAPVSLGAQSPASKSSVAKPVATAEIVKHASDCINSVAGMLQIIELFIKRGAPIPEDLRHVMNRTMEQSMAQTMLSLPHWDFTTLRVPASLTQSYIPDWIVTLLSTLVWLYLGVAQPHYQPFSVHDKAISYPYVPPHQQTVTVPMLFAVSIAMPVAVIVMVSVGFKRNLHDLHVGLLGLLMGVSLTLMFTNSLKNVLGRPRPSLLARCLPTMPSHALDDPPQGLSTISICTQTNMAVLNEGFRSFPSGHTSLAFAGMTYLAYYMAGKLHVFDRQGFTYKSFMVFMPLLIAATVGATRVADYWHHPTDVFVGAVIGMCTATFSYHQYFPLLISPVCDRPYDPRKRLPPVLPLHVHLPAAHDHPEGHICLSSHVSPAANAATARSSTSSSSTSLNRI